MGQQSWREFATSKLPLPTAIYLIAFCLPFSFHLGSVQLTLVRAVLLVLIIPQTINLITGRYGKLIWTDILFLLHIIWSTIAISRNNPEMVISNSGSTAIEFLGGYILARATIRDRASFLALCRWLGVIVLITIPLALYESRTDNPILINTLRKLPGLQGYTDVQYETRMGLYRAQVLLPHPILYGLFCSTALSITMISLKGVLPNIWRYTLTTSAVLGVLLSLSSGALLPMALQIGMYVWAWALQKQKNRWWFLIALMATGWVVIDILSNRSPMLVIMSYATFSAHNAWWRLHTFEWGMVNIWANPVFGIGFNDWVRPPTMHTSSVDNFWLLTAMRYGIPGFALIVTGYFYALLKIIWRDFSTDALLSQIRLGWVLTFISLTLTLCTVHVWHSTYSYVFFLFGSGMWILNAQPFNSTQKSAKKADNDPSISRKLQYSRFATDKHRRLPPPPAPEP